MILLDLRQFMVDDAVKIFTHDRRIDLLAAASPPVFPASPEFLVYQYKAEPQTVMLIKAFVPYAQYRVNVGLEDAPERFQFIPSSVGNTQLVFTPYINDSALSLIDWQYNPPNTAATATNIPVAGKGVTTISQEPKMDAERAWFNPMTTYAMVPPGSTFSVTFQIMPTGDQGTPMSGNFEIGGDDPAQRIDCAGCYVTGMQLSLQAYNEGIAALKAKHARKVEQHSLLQRMWALANRKWGGS